MRNLWRKIGLSALCGAALWAGVGLAPAQEKGLPAPLIPPATLDAPKTPTLGIPTAPPATNDAADLKARIERLERQNQELLDALKGLKKTTTAPTSTSADPNSQGLNANDVRAIINGYFGEKEAQAKKAAADAPAPSFTVGKHLNILGTQSVSGTGSGASQMWFESPDKAFRMHVGGRIQPDVIFGAGTRSNAGNNIEQGKGGTGAFQEGFNFRRARLEVDGWMYETIDYFVEFDWANTPFNTGVKGGNTTVAGTPTGTQPFSNILNVPAPTDVWAGINKIPVIGMVRFGNLKPVIGLDHLTSSRYLDFMERSIGFDTYYNRNNGFEPGFLIANNTEDERLTAALSITRTCNGPFGFDQGGGAWDYTGRLTWLPYYEDNGRHMVHLGLAGKYQRLDSSTGTGVASFNDRWLLRNSQSGLQNVVSFVNLVAVDQEIIQPELFVNMGPLSIQAEWIGSRVNGVTSFNNQVVGPTAVPSRTFYSQTAYVQAMYFLTGESRPYGKTYSHGSGPAPTRVMPFSNFYWVPGQTGNLFSSGAWQVGARYCYSTLNDGPINGGIVNEVTLGLNWFLNPNMKVQWNYDIGHRDMAAAGGKSSGYYYGFGMRMALDF